MRGPRMVAVSGVSVSDVSGNGRERWLEAGSSDVSGVSGRGVSVSPPKFFRENFHGIVVDFGLC